MAGVNQLKIPAFMKRKLASYASFTGMGEDAADGLAYFTNGRLQIDYEEKNSSIYSDFNKAFDRVNQITGNPVSTLPTPLTVHQCGGAKMGQTIKEGVVGYNGEVFDNPGLYVCDSTSLPGPAGGPPSMTVAAWSFHIGELLVKDESNTAVKRKPAAKKPRKSSRATKVKTA